MTAEPALFDTPYPVPTGYAYGKALNLTWFIPALTDPKHHLEHDVVAKERPRAKVISGSGGKPFAQFYTPPKTQAWESYVNEWSLRQVRSLHLPGDQDFILPIVESRVLMFLRFNLRKPASYPKSVEHHVKKPDVDNLEKAVLDGIVMAGILGDDCLITDLSACKRYAGPGHPPGVEIDLTAIAL